MTLNEPPDDKQGLPTILTVPGSLRQSFPDTSASPSKRPPSAHTPSWMVADEKPPPKRLQPSDPEPPSCTAEARRKVGADMAGSSTAGQVSFLEAAATALSRAEETGGTRTVTMARGPAGTPVPVDSLLRPNATLFGSEHQNWDPAFQMPESADLLEYLSLDERPIFAVSCEHSNLHGEGLFSLYANNSLKSNSVLHQRVTGLADHGGPLGALGAPFPDFRAWVLSPLSRSETISTFPFAGVVWRSSVIRRTFKVITGQPDFSSPIQQSTDRSQEASSTGIERPDAAPLQSPGYFDAIPNRHRNRFGAASVSPGEQSRSPMETSSTPHGDLAYSDLLSGPLSPDTEQITFPPKTQSDSRRDKEWNGLPEKGFYDWTRLPLSNDMGTHIRFARGIDWGSTSLGSIEKWPSDLRAMCNLIMASPHPAAMYWGSDHVAIYNEPYILLAGHKHPSLMGSRYCDAWAEIWDALKDVFDEAYRNAQATMKDDDRLFISRNGFLEETYFSWSIIPLISSDGSVAGLYNPAFEKTRRKVAERRMLTLREVGEKTATARQITQFWNLLLEGLSYNEFDAPLVMIYSLDNDLAEPEGPSSASSSGAATKVARLEGALGISAGHKAAPPVIDLKTSNEGFAWTFRQAITQDGPVVLRADNGTLDMSLLCDIEWRGFGDPSRVLVVLPIHPTTSESTLGFVIIGTNPRRPYDEDYELFVQLLARQLATSIASVVLFKEEIRKNEIAAKLAAQDRIELNNQLVARTQEAVEAENKFTRMAELAPVGMYIGDSEGMITFVNDAWYDISGYPRDKAVQHDWINAVLEEDKPRAWECWQTMLKNKCPVSMEFRFKHPRRDRLGNICETWVLASTSPEKDEDGNIKRIFGSITDISSQKFAENMHMKRMEEAVELKRQQERYVDTTSHEMRNPLSAMLQCADSITSSLAELQDTSDLTASQQELVDMSMDSAQTISLCAQHQKRIVDDVLILSKLDSAMASVAPVHVQPMTVVRRVLKMFESELQTADITFETKVSPEYQKLGIDWVMMDPHRLSQVLINLTTNAIKFTTMQEKRSITLYASVSLDRPSQEDNWDLTFVPTRQSKDRDVTASAEWGPGVPVYLKFAIRDSGPGLDEMEKKQLFQRFSQASPKTHVQYGGTGLGLFISRELVELQGGQIGVRSEAGKGSTFAFYVKARRTEPPASVEDSPYNGSYQHRKGPKGSKKMKSQSLYTTSQPPSPKPNELSKTMSAPPGAAGGQHTLRILVVEDNLINQRVLATQLRKIGCVVHVANHGGEAIDQIRRSKYFHIRASDAIAIDVVLLDLEMPVMDGQTCARKLREMQSSGAVRSHIPIIAVTANAREEQIQMAKDSGMDDVVSKPFRIPELVPRMREVVSRFEKD